MLYLPSSMTPGQAQTDDSGQPAQVAPRPLTGSVEVSTTLPALDSELTPGNRYDPALLGLERPSNRWILIPTWLAGEWHLAKVVFHSKRATGGPEQLAHDITENDPPMSSKIFGQQSDKTGAIWHFIGVPATTHGVNQRVTSGVRSGDDKALFTVAIGIEKRNDIISEISTFDTTDSGSFRFLESMISITTDDEDDTIKEAHQQQVLFKYFREADGNTLKATLVNRAFDSQGNPTGTQKCENHYTRVNSFKSVDKQGDLDLHQLFIDYLKSSGQQDLLP